MASKITTTTTAITLLYILIPAVLLFFLISPNYASKPPILQRRSLFNPEEATKCSLFSSSSLLNYSALHSCVFRGVAYLSIPFLTLTLALYFYILVKTAQDRFSVVVTKLSNHMKLSPSMGAVTLLALGNGAPDVFASVAAVRSGQPRTGFGAILSAGTFVSALVVGFVAIYAAPFKVETAPFVRDVLFYLTAALFLFYVYLSAEIYLWQAVGFVGFYLFFVGIVFSMDLGYRGDNSNIVGDDKSSRIEEVPLIEKVVDCETGELSNVLVVESNSNPGFWKELCFRKISKAWEVPVSILLKLTIPPTSPSEWSRFYQSTNIALCPLALLYSCRSFVPLNHPIVFLPPSTHIPMWSLVLFASSSLATLHYVLEKEPPKNEQITVIIAAFIMSVFWISTTAGELLSCLEALGILLKIPPSFLGLTVLAWGNSVGDLVADVAVAKAGQPAMAMAGCFACPMFNMLFGLGTGLVIQSADVFPEAYKLQFHTSIVVAFVFLILSLMGSLLVVTWNRFRVPRFWGFCLVGLYVSFMAVSSLIVTFSS